MWKLISIAIVLLLIYIAVMDIYQKRISLLSLILIFVPSCLRFIKYHPGTKETLINLIIICVLFIISFISRGAIGYADIILLSVTGVSMNSWNFIMYVFTSFVLSGLVGTLLIFIFRKDKKYEMPFCPFVALSYFASMLL